MGFPDHPSDRDRQSAPNMHVPPDQPDDAASAAETVGPQQPGGYQPPGYPIGAPAGRVNSMSIAAIVCGLAQFVLWFLLLVPGFIAALLGLVFGIVALGQIKQRGETGRGMAFTGIVLGALGVLGGIGLGILIGVGSAHYHAHMGY